MDVLKIHIFEWVFCNLFVSRDRHLIQKGFSCGLWMHVIAMTIGVLHFILTQQKPYASASFPPHPVL